MANTPAPPQSIGQQIQARATTLADVTNMIWYKTTIRIYPVTDSKLDELTAGYNSLYLVFFGVCVGAAISLSIAFKQTTAPADKPYYLASFLASVLGAIGFGFTSIKNYIRANRAKKHLYEHSIPLEASK